MSTADSVIDQLKVVVELDPTKFKEGQAAVAASFDATKAKGRKAAEELESSGKQGSQFFDLLTDKALRLGTVLLGGVGIKDLIQNSIAGGAATGYMAKNIGISAQELTKLQTVVRQVGGDANQVGPALLGLSQALTAVQLNGRANPDMVQAFNYLGIYGAQLVDQATGRLKTLAELLPAIQVGLANLSKQQGAPFAVAIAAKIGLPQDLTNAFISPDYRKFEEAAARVSSLTEKQTRDLQRVVSVWGLYKGALETTGYELVGDAVPAFDEIADGIAKTTKALESFGSVGKFVAKEFERDLGVLVGGITGGVAGSALGPIGTAIGIIVGAIGGGAIGSAADRTQRALQPPGSTAAPAASAPAPAPSAPATGSDRARDRYGRRAAAEAETAAPTADDLKALATFNLIHTLEGGKPGTITPTNKAADPFAYGNNQITLGTAKKYDKNATAEKLLDADYNDALARKIQADYLARYGGNLDAVAIAYHNGPGAADAFVRNGGSTAGIADFGQQSQAYLERERALAASSGSTSTSSSTANVGTINVNAPKANDAAGVAAAIREELANYSLLSQANMVGAQ